MKRLLMALPLVLCMNANAGFVTGYIVGSAMSSNQSGQSSNDGEQFVQYDPNTTIQCEYFNSGWCLTSELLKGTKFNTVYDSGMWSIKARIVCEADDDTCVTRSGGGYYKYDIDKVMTRMGFTKIKSVIITKKFGTYVEFE